VPNYSDGLAGTPHTVTQVLLGIFCRNKDRYDRVVQRLALEGGVEEALRIHRVNITVRFVIGENSTELWDEHQKYGDILVLNIQENMDEGKTFDWFHAATRQNDLSPPPDLIAKMDTDVLLFVPEFAKDVASLPKHDLVYWGRKNDWETCWGWKWPWCPPKTCTDFAGVHCEDSPKGRLCEECWIYMSGGMYMLSFRMARLLDDCEACKAWRKYTEDMAMGHSLNATLREHNLVEHAKLFHRENGDLFLHNDQLKGQNALLIVHEYFKFGTIPKNLSVIK